MKISVENSNRIKTLSVICTFFVVALHTCANYEVNSLSWYLKTSFEHGVCRMAVPFFFVVSGFFIAVHLNEEGWWLQCVHKRLKTVGVPYLFWSFVEFMFVLLLISIANVVGHRPVLQGVNLSW